VEPLIKALDDEYGEVCEYAARALGQIGDARAVEPLIKALGDHYGPPMGWFRRHAAAALEAIGGPRAMEVLEDVHWDDPEQFRIEGLIKALVNVDVFISFDALARLIKIGEPAVEPLIKATYGRYFDEDSEGDIEEEHGQSLSQIAMALGGIGDARAVGVLIEMLSDSYACEEAADALARIGKPAVEPLIKALGDEDDDVRASAKEVLQMLGHEVEYGED
jgi:HEAT repeat protein